MDTQQPEAFGNTDLPNPRDVRQLLSNLKDSIAAVRKAVLAHKADGPPGAVRPRAEWPQCWAWAQG